LRASGEDKQRPLAADYTRPLNRLHSRWVAEVRRDAQILATSNICIADLNMKKSWHPQLLKNQERVWLEEKKAVRESTFYIHWPYIHLI
jgi:CBF1 interacting co-repressor CIR-like protein